MTWPRSANQQDRRRRVCRQLSRGRGQLAARSCREERAGWFDVSVFGNQAAENIAQQFKKGDLVYCAGPVSLHTYTAQGSSETGTTLRLNATDARIVASANRDSSMPKDQQAQAEFHAMDET